jgi:hypothetical protein
MFELVNIFEVFLPQLLQDPNPKDPLNGEAAMLLMKDAEKYKARVMEHVKKYAGKDKFGTSMDLNKAAALKSSSTTITPVVNNLANDGVKNTNMEESKSVHSELSNASDYHSD